MSVNIRCRLCGVKCQEYLNISDKEEIYVKISCCLQITISKEDVLPKIICCACSSNLELSYDFFTKSQMAQLFLNELYGSITNEKQTTIEHTDNETQNLKTITKESIDCNKELLIHDDKSNVNEKTKEHDTKDQLSTLHSNPKKKKCEKLVVRQKKTDELVQITETQEENTIITSNIEKNTRENKLKIRKFNEVNKATTTSTDKLTYTTSVYNFCLPDVIQEYQWTCAICEDFNVNNFPELYQHYKALHNREPSFKCNICDKVYEVYASFIKHLKLHRDFNQYKCTTCNKTFSQKGILLSHQTVHSNERPHTCCKCGKSFKKYSSLQTHNKLHLPDDMKEKFICEFCKKQFSTKHTLIMHRRLHTGERNFMCDICGKSFTTKGSLVYHIAGHAEDKNFKCKECNKCFKTARVLNNHVILHSAIKPYQCDVCGKQFHVRRRLQDHHRIHTGDMPYKCEFCEKSFRFSGILTIHRRQHTGERPYICTDCLRSFTNWSNYNKHMKRIHHTGATNSEKNNKYKKKANGIEIKAANTESNINK
ncbi:zinc finger protein OZF-like isoform X3 [Vespa mandarinia]|uniref:zinc finger protein OZF-like isoform X3 n=1 Tax=Vespa mandarinia TaxID=7446 RepID=UPI001621D8F7|nr:zinc finger protein OZF-like isoform X3 [Vespa mandarinia]